MIAFEGATSDFFDAQRHGDLLEAARTLPRRVREHEYGGWVDLPENYDRDELERVRTAAEKIQSDSDFLVCIGVGGSYLGQRAVVEALGGERGRTKLLYAGNSLSARALRAVADELGDKDFSINVISKSGTTTEPAVALRVLKKKLIEKYGEAEAARRIYATTDAESGVLRREADERGYASFVVPNNIGGRYSVLTSVGLLAIAVAGYDVGQLLAGASEEREVLLSDGGAAAEYAAQRNALLARGFDIEVMANFEPQLGYFNEWWKQLFGESEGKGGKGIFPASVINTTDLHSMGQYIQDGRRNLFETFLTVESEEMGVTVPALDGAMDGLAYLEGKELDFINRKAAEATRVAHVSGGVPVLEVKVPDLSERSMGALIYFFEMSCALSGFLLGVNPFDQPGVEAYKKKMFELLGKPEA